MNVLSNVDLYSFTKCCCLSLALHNLTVKAMTAKICGGH